MLVPASPCPSHVVAARCSDACNGVAEALKTMSLNINAVEFVPPVVTGAADSHAHMNGQGKNAAGINRRALSCPC